MVKFKKVCCLLLCAVCVALAACAPAGNVGTNNATPRQDGTVVENDRYKVYVEDGQWYMEVKELDLPPELISDPYTRTVEFKSVEEMKSDILTVHFTEKEWGEISAYVRVKSEKERKIEISNIDELFAPVYPDPYNSYTVEWFFTYYTFHIKEKFTKNGSSLSVRSMTFFENITERFDNWPEYIVSTHKLENDNIRIETEEERNATAYYFTTNSGIEYMDRLYTVEQDGRIFYIREQYRGDESTALSLETPKRIDVYSVINNNYCYHLITSGRHSVEWLTSFGVVPYVEE